MMDIIKRGVSLLFSIFLLCLLLAALAEAMEVHDVVGLVQSGFDDNTIMAIMRKTGAAFHLSEEDRQKLKAAGVSERLVTFMANPSAVPLPPAKAGPPVKSKPRTSPPSRKPVNPSVHTSPIQAQSITTGLSQGRTQGQEEPWQGDLQGSGSQPTEQSQATWSQGGVPHPQIIEIPPVQLPEEESKTLAAIPPQERWEKEEKPSTSSEAIVTVTVTDRKGYYITGLREEDLHLYEDGILRPVISLTPDRDTPVSVGILLDTSGSMVDKLEEAEDGLRHFVNTIHPEDDVFLFEFNDTPRLVQDFTSDREAFIRTLGRLRASGSTSLYDVIAAGLKKIHEGRHRKKALILITDGNDTASKRSLGEVMDLARRSGVLIYCLGIGHGERGSFGHLGLGYFSDQVNVAALRALSEATGGSTFIIQGAHVVEGIDVIDQACQQVASELRLQYTLRYLSASRANGEKGHSLRVDSPRRDLTVRARNEYYVE